MMIYKDADDQRNQKDGTTSGALDKRSPNAVRINPKSISTKNNDTTGLGTVITANPHNNEQQGTQEDKKKEEEEREGLPFGWRLDLDFASFIVKKKREKIRVRTLYLRTKRQCTRHKRIARFNPQNSELKSIQRKMQTKINNSSQRNFRRCIKRLRILHDSYTAAYLMQ